MKDQAHKVNPNTKHYFKHRAQFAPKTHRILNEIDSI